ncbi:MAG: hypothetical protein ABSE90_08030 [Verrucomicrobiota bacterium]
MKLDLYRLSDRLCKIGCVMIAIDYFYPNIPVRIGGIGFVVVIAGLLSGLADEIIERKRREWEAAHKITASDIA